ncbi:MAG: dTDP-4-dehydrorhamnose 3,5-epimerase [Pontiellaceae bacterium]|nr:dTDP-4-dehydrorhamnose 3,5-epimerase [Pontiellaceae bacterium]MBN2784533.1 dTDP-4-dehydrorhamnose 3,5-epimerase [Pontiellaceae bacterium]
MEVINLSIPDVKLIRPRRFDDARGFFQQSYRYDEYAATGITTRFVQDNWSRSSHGVVRGLHYQLKHPQAKLVSVLRGEIYDVVVDIRQASPTFGQWVGATLSDETGEQLFVPEGFAHGFCVLSETVDLTYKCGDYYTPGDEYGIRWNDPDIAIEWPDSIISPNISDKDNAAPLLNDLTPNHLF